MSFVFVLRHASGELELLSNVKTDDITSFRHAVIMFDKFSRLTGATCAQYAHSRNNPLIEHKQLNKFTTTVTLWSA